MQSLLARALLLAPLVAAAVIAVWEFVSRRRLALRLAESGAVTAFCLAALSLLIAGFVESPASLRFSPWLAVNPRDTLQITFGLDLHPSAVGLASVMALSTFCSMAANRLAKLDEWSERIYAIGASLLLFSSMGVVLSTNFAELFIFWQLTAVSSYMLSSACAATTRSAVAAKRLVIAQRISDFLLLCAICALAVGFRTLDFEALFGNRDVWTQAAAQNSALIEFICLCLLGACIGRCALFPLFGWLDELAESPIPVHALIQGVCLVPCGALLLYRCVPLLQAAVNTAPLSAVLTGTSALLAAVCALAASDVRRTAGFACVSAFSLILFGLCTEPPLGRGTGPALLLVLYIPTSALVLGAITLGAVPSSNNPVNVPADSVQPSALIRGGLAASIGLLFSGIFGQGRILIDALSFGSTVAGGSETRTPGLAILLAAAAESVAAYSILRAFLTRRGREPAGSLDSPLIIDTTPVCHDSPPQRTSRDWPYLLLAACGAVIGVLAIASVALPLGDGPRIQTGWWLVGTFGGSIPALAGFAVAWWQVRGAQQTPYATVPDGVLIRLGRSRFYCDAFLFLCVALPVRGAAQLARFVDWFFIDGVISGLPASLAESVARLFEPLQRRSTSFYLVTSGVGTVVLTAVIVWLRD